MIILCLSSGALFTLSLWRYTLLNRPLSVRQFLADKRTILMSQQRCARMRRSRLIHNGIYTTAHTTAYTTAFFSHLGFPSAADTVRTFVWRPYIQRTRLACVNVYRRVSQSRYQIILSIQICKHHVTLLTSRDA